MKIEIVPDEYGACPRCGAYWGHPNKDLDFPNRNKVDHYWRCYNPKCTAGYYDPNAKKVVEDKLSPEAEAEMNKRVHDEVQAMMVGKTWAETEPGVFSLVPEETP